MLMKKKVLYNVIARDNEDEIGQCIESILGQVGVDPYISVSCVETSDKSFFIAKSFCSKPTEIHPNFLLSKKICVFRTNTEQSSINNGLVFSKSSGIENYCFMQTPGIINREFSAKALPLIKDDVIGVYCDNLMDGVKFYSNLAGDKEINVGSYLFLKKSIAQMFNHPNMGEFLKDIVNLGVFIHIPEFLVESKWIKSVLRRQMAMSRAV